MAFGSYDAWKTTDRYAEEQRDEPEHTETVRCWCGGRCADDPDEPYDDDTDMGVGPHAAWASKYDHDWDDDGSR